MAERAEQTKTLFVHISQVSSSLFLIFLRDVMLSLFFFGKISIGIVYTLDLCQTQHQNVLVDEKRLRILLQIVEIRLVFASIIKGFLANFSKIHILHILQQIHVRL